MIIKTKLEKWKCRKVAYHATPFHNRQKFLLPVKIQKSFICWLHHAMISITLFFWIFRAGHFPVLGKWHFTTFNLSQPHPHFTKLFRQLSIECDATSPKRFRSSQKYFLWYTSPPLSYTSTTPFCICWNSTENTD